MRKVKRTTEEFIIESMMVHGDRYEYNLAEYKHSREKCKIICRKHGTFLQTPAAHLSGQGCLKCKLEQRTVTTSEFIEKAVELNGSKYDYSLVNCVNAKTKVKIICKIHGEFEQASYRHLEGQQCQSCVLDRSVFNYSHKCKDKDFASRNGCVYLFEMEYGGEIFYKVGVSVRLKERKISYKSKGIDLGKEIVWEMTALESSVIEGKVLKFIRDNGFRYKPLLNFDGVRECFDIQYLDQVVSFINSELKEQNEV